MESIIMIVQCGFPRAGSTLLYLMMRSSVSNYHFFDKEQRALTVISKGVITKRPMDIFDYKEILQKIDAKFIINIRDPRSVVTSVHAHSEGQYKVSWDRSLLTGPTGIRPGKTKGLLDYIKIVRKVPRAIFVSYEDLVQDPDVQQKRLGDFCGFIYKDSFSNFYKHSVPSKLQTPLNGVRPVDVSNIDKWKEHPERIKQQFKECPELFDVLIYFGYEKDKTWINRL